jgi:hypothetical protein
VTDVLDECFAQFIDSAGRLETLKSYSVPGEAERIAAWRARKPRPERSVRTNGYLREVAEHALAGRQRIRIRVVDAPASEYVRYQLTGYVESQAAGEEIWIAVRNGRAKRDLSTLPAGDFWVFDLNHLGAHAVLMDYDEGGRFTGSRFATPDEFEACAAAWVTASGHAVPLNEYLAKHHASSAVA